MVTGNPAVCLEPGWLRWLASSAGDREGDPCCSSEAAHIRRLRARDEEALGDLLLLYRRRVLNLAYRILADADAAEDAAQEAFVRAFYGANGLRARVALWPWLRRITLNVCLAERTRASRRPAPAPVEEEASRRAVPPADRLAVHAALAALSPALRAAIVLRELEGLSYAEIAQHLGIPIGTVRSRLADARRKLKEFLLRE
jgi:RNA polymerase sigma-70 factor (ECF subfamily)